jgi:hypothetical protein
MNIALDLDLPMTPRCLLATLATLAWALPSPPSVTAQGGELDRGVLLVMRGSTIVGREEFVVRSTGGSGSASRFTVVTTAVYPPQRPQRSIEAAVEFGADSLLTASRREAGNGGATRVLIGVGPRRITVRSAIAGNESAREYPASEPPLILDDSVYAAHALFPALGTVRVRAITLDGRRGPAVRISDHGFELTAVGSRQLRLRRLSLTSDAGTRTLWYDADGRIMKIDDQPSGVVVLRALDREGTETPR